MQKQFLQKSLPSDTHICACPTLDFGIGVIQMKKMS